MPWYCAHCSCVGGLCRCFQVHSLLNVVRPDRQTLLFSATLPRKIEALVAEALSNPVRISVGLLGAANADVTQRVEVMQGGCGVYLDANSCYGSLNITAWGSQDAGNGWFAATAAVRQHERTAVFGNSSIVVAVSHA